MLIFWWRNIIMDKNQKINCTVNSCKYNNCHKQECDLESIVVTPVTGVNTEEPDESMCSSYECNCK